MKKRSLVALIGLVAIAAGVSAALLRPRPTRLAVTPRAGDDTVVINQMRSTRLSTRVLDQYGRLMSSDTALSYRWIGGDTLRVSRNGEVRCVDRRDAEIRATFMHLVRDFVLRCRPVASIEAASWVDLLAGDSARDLAFIAHGPDGNRVTELRGVVTVGDASIAAIEATSIRPKGPGQTFVTIEVGGRTTSIPIMVYQPVTSFVDNAQKMRLMAMRVDLARGDTMWLPLPKAAFWVTYFSGDRNVAPPTIELVGEGSCTTGNGLQERRIEEGEYAKYCFAGRGTRMMVAHGASGAPRVAGIVALRIMW
jgi:hypothetical protein